MKWRIKAHGMAVLSRLPLGKRIYARMQKILGTNRLSPDEGVTRALEISQMAQRAGVSVRDSICFEIGTGWRPYVPFLLQLLGAMRTISVDVNPWLTHRYAVETLQALGERIARVAESTSGDVEEIRERFLAVEGHHQELGSLLTALGIEYCCPGDARDTKLAAASVDIVCSSNVLEHVSEVDLQAIHCESFRILRPGGIVVHRFNPADHFSFVDKSISSVNFLQFSASQWHWLGGSGLSFHNRLRCPQHLQLVKSLGFEIVESRVRTDERALEALRRRKLRLHPDFSSFSDEELAADYMWLVARRPS